ncbi:ThiF family adenylyltransferase [Cupriavidus necator]
MHATYDARLQEAARAMIRPADGFSYEQAFSRNVGWVTLEEQQRLREARVAIAGLGGVGGSHVTTLARLGIGALSIADFDTFDYSNFNRQAGATLASVGKAKVQIAAAMASDINPEMDIRIFPGGVSSDNIDAFLDGVSVYVDGLDFFAFEARQLVFAACRAKGIPAVTAAPLGMGAAVLVFMPQGMSFEDYFGFEGRSNAEKALRFLVGLAPARLHSAHLVVPSRIDLTEQRGPSTAMGCMLCSGVAATEALKLILGRGPVWSAPWGYQFDAFGRRMGKTWRPGGHRNPLQRLAISIGQRRLGIPTAKP